MGKAIRIQRKRTKGWRMPENTKYIGRGSGWGNEYEIGIDGNRHEVCVKYRQSWGNNPHFIEAVKKKLKGFNLACWCPTNKECHGDWLLQIANS